METTWEATTVKPQWEAAERPQGDHRETTGEKWSTPRSPLIRWNPIGPLKSKGIAFASDRQLEGDPFEKLHGMDRIVKGIIFEI